MTDHANGASLRDILESARPARVQAPPHEDQMETAIEAKIDAVVQEQSAHARRRIDELNKTIEHLTRVMDLTSKKAKLALQAHTRTLIAVRVNTEKLEEVVRELAEGHEELKGLYDN